MGEARTYVHAARARLEPGGDPAALGGAVTVGLCGAWEHDGPCLWPHHSATEAIGGAVDDLTTTVRTVFRARPEHQTDVRRLLDAALSTGRLAGPDGSASVWRLLDSGPAEPTDDEKSLGDRLAGLAGSSG